MTNANHHPDPTSVDATKQISIDESSEWQSHMQLNPEALIQRGRKFRAMGAYRLAAEDFMIAWEQASTAGMSESNAHAFGSLPISYFHYSYSVVQCLINCD